MRDEPLTDGTAPDLCKVRSGLEPGMRWLILGICLLLVAAGYWPGLPGGFVFDDYPNIISQKSVHLRQLTWAGLWDAAFAYTHGFQRPVSNVTFALNYFFVGLDPTGYKWTNLGLHLVNTLLVARLAHLILTLASTTTKTIASFPVLIAAVWAVHPLQVSTVLYVVQRMEIMCATFILVSLIAYIQGRKAQIEGSQTTPWHFAACVIGSVLALGSKETAFLIPLYALAIEYFIIRFRASSPRVRSFWRASTVAGSLLSLLVLLLANAHLITSERGFYLRDFGPTERILSQLEVIPLYLGLILVPRIDTMRFFYDDVVAPTRFTLEAATGSIIILMLLFAIFKLRRSRPVASFGVTFFLASHLITSSALSLELVFEHRNYLSIFGIVIALAGMVPTQYKGNVRLLLLTCATLTVVLTALTAIRSSYWSSPTRLALYLVEISPNSQRARMDLGEQYMLAAAGDVTSPLYHSAVSEYKRAAMLPPVSIMGEHGLLVMAARYQQPADPAWWDSMIQKLSSPPIRPQEVAALLSMVEHRMNGLELDSTQLARSTLELARTQALAPELLFLFAHQALLSDDGGTVARELFARALLVADPEYAIRAKKEIAEIVGPEFLRAVELQAKRIDQQLKASDKN